jgi:hypothetical protein
VQYGQRRSALETAFIEKLQAGTVIASAIARADDARRMIRPALWGVLSINYDSNDLGGSGRKYEVAEFFEPPAIPTNIDEIPDWFRELPAVRGASRTAAPAGLPAPIMFAVDGKRVVFAQGIALSAKQSKLILELLPKFQDDRTADRNPDEYRFTPLCGLLRPMGSNEVAVRRLIARVRHRLMKEHKERLGLDLHRDSIIENHRWQGYRLNPRLLLVPLFQLRKAD